VSPLPDLQVSDRSRFGDRGVMMHTYTHRSGDALTA
jgi:hypothetical protein